MMPLTAQLDEMYNNIMESKFFRVLNDFDKHITRNLNMDNIETRPSSSNGLWCCLLLPTILVIYALRYPVSLLYSMMACIAIGCLCYCLLFIVFMSVSCLVLKEQIYGGCLAPGAVSTLLFYTLLDQGFIFSLVYSTLSVLMFSELLRHSLTMFPKTFTIGEAMVVVQSVTLFAIMIVTRLFYYDIRDKSDTEMDFVFNIVLTVLSSVGIIVTALAIMEEEQKTVKTVCYVISVTGVYALILLHGLVGFDCLITIASYLCSNTRRIQLFFIWACLVLAAALAILSRMQMAVKATTVTRKVFHVLASAVFMSGIIIDIHFMTLAAGCGLGAIILMEAFRKAEIQDITPVLQGAFKIYSDEQDVGYFAMTPIYLYVGLACPLVLIPVHKDYKLELLSGVLSLGVGDTAASWFGSKYGFNKWAGGKKTFEGTLFNILSQIMTVYFLDLFGLLNVDNALLRIILAAVITGLVEAKTQQIDNLVLPLLSIISLQITNIVGLLFLVDFGILANLYYVK